MVLSKFQSKYFIIFSVLFNLLFILLGIKNGVALYNQPKRVQVAGYWLHRDTYLASLPGDSSDILLIGDSETQQFEAAEMLGNSHIKNRGINYDTSVGILNRISMEIKHRPAKIFLQAGINDLIKGFKDSSIISNFKGIIDSIGATSPASKIYINSVFPSNKCSSEKIISLNNDLKQLCFKYNLVFIDVYASFEYHSALNKVFDCGDGLHLSYEGYLKWKTILQPYIYE